MLSVGLKWFLNRVFGSRYWFVGLCVLLVSAGVAYASVSVPVGVTYPDLEPTDSQPYVLEVPSFDWSYYVDHFSNGTCYSVNASNGDMWVTGTDAVVLDAVEDCAGVLYFADGNYSVSSTFNALNGTSVVGESYNGVWFVAVDDLNATMFSFASVTGCSMRNVCIDGNGDGQDSSAIGVDVSTVAVYGVGFSMEWVDVEDCYFTCLKIVSVNAGVSLRNVRVSASSSVVTAKGCDFSMTDSSVDSLIVTGSPAIGMQLGGACNMFSNCYFGGSGYEFNVELDGVYGWNVYLSTASYCQFSGCVVADAGRVGVYASDDDTSYVRFNTFVGGVIHNNGWDSGYADRCDVMLTGNSHNNTFTGVVLGNSVGNEGYATHGFTELNSCNWNYLVYCRFPYVGDDYDLVGAQSLVVP